MRIQAKVLTLLVFIVFTLVSAIGCVGAQGTLGLVTTADQVANDDALLAENARLGFELEQAEDYLSQLEDKLQATEALLASVESNQFQQHNPTLDEALRFLGGDTTDSRDYVDSEYICIHFACDVNNAAERQGIRCAVVLICFQEQNHVIIGFDTIDAGMIYFEPQTDERVKPVVGKEFWQCIESKSGYYYEKPAYNDTILDIIVTW